MRQPLILLTSLLAVQVASQSTTQDALSSYLSSYSSYFDSITRASQERPSSTLTGSSNAITVTSSEPTIEPSTGSLETLISGTGRSRTTELLSTQSNPITSISSQASSQSESQISSTATSSNTSNAGQTESAAAATTNTSAPSASSGSNRDRTIAIAVGTVLGALALGLFVLLLIIICGRRRNRRDAKRRGPLASASEEAVTFRNKSSSNPAPVAAAFNPRQSQPIDQRGSAKTPLMSERSNLPSMTEYRNDYNVPYIPGSVEERRSSGLLPTHSNDSARTDSRFPGGTGLNNHPYHESHYTGSTLASGTGAAGSGAATAGRSLSDEKTLEPTVSEDLGIHPAFLNEPPARSPKRNSLEGMERPSGSEPGGRFYGPQDNANSSLRIGDSLADADRGTGAATGNIITRTRDSGRERGRGLATDPLLDDEQSEGTAIATPRNSRGKRVSAYQSLSQDIPTTDLPSYDSETTDTFGEHAFEPAIGIAALETGKRNDMRTRSYPIPPSLTIPDPNLKRSRLSRGSKRARFAGGDTYHEPAAYGRDQVSDNGISPPGTARSANFNSGPRRSSAGTAETEELVSPISPNNSTRGIGRNVSITHGRASFVDVPRDRNHSPHRIRRRPVSDTSYRVSPPTSESNSTPDDEPAPARKPRPHSGLVTAVRDQFNPSPPQPHQTYKAYAPPETIRPSALAPITNTTSTPSAAERPITRKPVPRSRYSGWKPLPQLPTDSSGGATRENWWRNQEDSALSHNYSRIGDES